MQIPQFASGDSEACGWHPRAAALLLGVALWADGERPASAGCTDRLVLTALASLVRGCPGLINSAGRRVLDQAGEVPQGCSKVALALGTELDHAVKACPEHLGCFSAPHRRPAFGSPARGAMTRILPFSVPTSGW